jgi:hypothetical protein
MERERARVDRGFLLAGHSHARALGLPPELSTGKPRIVTIPNVDGAVGLVGLVDRNSEYWDALIDNAGDKTVLLLYGGNQHLARFLLAPDPIFDFYVSDYPEMPVDRSAFLIPETMVRDLLNLTNANLSNTLSRLKKVSGCDPVVLGTPPPKGDDVAIRSLLSKETHFVRAAEMRGIDLNDVPLSPRTLRYKLWLVVQSLLREAADAENCKFVSVPAGAMDEAGFLKKVYWRPDVTHANEAYGALMWKHIQNSVEFM